MSGCARRIWPLAVLLLAGCSRDRPPAAPAGHMSKAPARPTVAQPNHVRYLCDDGFAFSADVAVTQAVIHLSDGRSETLPHARSADGARYVGDTLTYWSRGRHATLEQVQGPRHRCHETGTLAPAGSGGTGH